MRPILILVLLVGFLSAGANTYYFSTSGGNDSRSASEAQNPQTPWKTIDKLNSFASNLQPGDVVLFKNGDVFDGSIALLKSGANGAPITFASYGSGSLPVISGLTTVTKWNQAGSNIWEADVASPAMINVLLYNGRMKALGRYPNVTAANNGYLTLESTSGNNEITDNQLAASPNWTGANVVIRKNRWVLDNNPVTSHSGNTIRYNSESPNAPSLNFGYFLQNHAAALDIEGEWYYKPTTQKLGIYSSGNPSARQVQVATTNTLVTIDHLSNLVFKDLQFVGANKSTFEISNSQHISIQNCRIYYSGVNAVSGSSVNNLTVENCDIRYSNNSALELRYCFHAVIRNNNISATGTLAGMGKGDSGSYEAIMIDGDDELIEGNQIDSTGYIPITFRGNTNIIRNNFINHFSFVKDDGGGIYSWNNIPNAPATFGSRVTGNIVINGTGAGGGTNNPGYAAANGIYMDDNTAGVEISDNTVANCGLYGIYIHNGHELNITRNTLFDNGTQIVLAHDDYAAYSPIRNVELNANKLISKETNQVVAHYLTSGNDIASFGNFDNNYYSRPTYDNFVIQAEYNNGSPVNKSFDVDSWKKAFSKDASSKRSPIGLASSDLIRFEYNATAVAKTVNLAESYIDVTGAAYSGTITLQPFTSVVLLRTQNIASVCPGTGSVKFEMWENVAGSSIASIPLQIAPSTTGLLNGSFEIFNAGDTYGSRLSGWLCPPQTGNYTFFLAGDDVAELWLSTSDDPSGKKKIAAVTAWTNFREWTKFSSQKSTPIALVAGQQYFIEALQKEGNGGDHVSVGWQLPDGQTEAPIPAFRVASGSTTLSQSIAFAPLYDVASGTSQVTLSATATSGLPVVFSVLNGPATITGNVLTITGVGSISVEASQPGNSSYNAAPSVTQTFSVNTVGTACLATGNILREQWNNIPGNTIQDVPLQSTPSSSGFINSFEAPSNIGDNYASRIRGYLCPPQTGNYTFYIAADDAAELYLSTSDNPAEKTRIAFVLSWTNPREWYKHTSQKSVQVLLQSGKRYYIEAIHKEGEGGDNLSVAWMLPSGSLEAPIAGSRLSPYAPVLSQAPQIITFPSPGDLYVGGDPVSLRASSTSGLPVLYRIVSGSGLLNGNQLRATGAGSITIEASQGGNQAFITAPPVIQVLAAQKGSQVITFPAIANQVQSGNIILNASSSSGLPIRYQVVNGPATIQNNVLTFSATGNVIMQAEQPGNSDYLAAPPVSRSFQVTAVAPATCSATGTILYERWNNVPGTTLNDLSFLNQPATSSTLNQLEANSNSGDNYAARIRGYVCPPQNGNYTFWIAGDDAAELWLSTTDNPNDKVRIAYVQSWTNPREWNKFPTQQSTVITLQAGRRYYIEVLHKEGGGGDNLAVSWQLPDNTREAPLSGTHLSPFVPAATTSHCENAGSIQRQQWNNVPGILLASSNFNTEPGSSSSLSMFEAGTNLGDNFASRIQGFVCPPQTGYYTFWIAGDDMGELWLSTNDQAENKVRIASFNSWTNPREWNKFSTQQSAPVYLQKGKLYYVEALHKEWAGGDHLSVGWKLPDNTVEAPIQGQHLVPITNNATSRMAVFSKAIAPATSGIEPNPLRDILKVYPSPASTNITIHFTNAIAGALSINLFDMNGKPVRSILNGFIEHAVDHYTKFSVRDLPAGIYMVRVNNSGRTSFSKLIISR